MNLGRYSPGGFINRHFWLTLIILTTIAHYFLGYSVFTLVQLVLYLIVFLAESTPIISWSLVILKPLVWLYEISNFFLGPVWTVLIFFALWYFRRGILGKIPVIKNLANWWYKERPRRKFREIALWKVIRKYGILPLLTKARKTSNETIRNFMRDNPFDDPYIEGELPFVFRHLRAELMTLMNYMTRLHTYFGKKESVTEAKEKSQIIEPKFGERMPTYDSRRSAIDFYSFNGKGNIQESTGWANNRDLIFFLFDTLNTALIKDNLIVERAHHVEELNPYVLGPLSGKLTAMQTNYGKTVTNFKRFGLLHRFKSLKMHTIDLVALYGAYKHYYLFASENALFELWRCKIDNNVNPDGSDNPVIWDVTPLERIEAWEKLRNRRYERIKEDVKSEIREKIEKRYRDELRMQEEYTQLEYYKNQMREVARKNNIPEERLNIGLANITKKLSEQKVRQSIENAAEKMLESRETQLKIDDEVEFEFANGTSVVVTDPTGGEPKSSSYENEIRRRMSDRYKLKFDATTSEGNFRHEVDVRGFVLADIHKYEVDHKDIKGGVGVLRRVKVEDMVDFPSDKSDHAKWSYVYSKMENEWDFFLKDLRYGFHHPRSRSYQDYDPIISTYKGLNIQTVSNRTAPSEATNSIAFDHEALRFPGLWVYWGKRNYWDTQPANENPYPTLSTVGLSSFLTSIIKMRQSEAEIHQRFLKGWAWETGGASDVFTDLPS